MPPLRVRTKWKGLVVTWHCCQDFLPAPPPILCKKIPHYQFVRFFLPPSFLLHQRRLGQRYVGSAASEPMEEICKALLSLLPRLPFTALYSGSSSFFFSVLLGKHDLKSNHRFLVSFLLFPHPPSSLFFLEAEWATEEKEEEEEGKEKKGEGWRAAPEEWGEGRSVRGLSVVRRERRGRKGREGNGHWNLFLFPSLLSIQSKALPFSLPPSFRAAGDYYQGFLLLSFLVREIGTVLLLSSPPPPPPFLPISQFHWLLLLLLLLLFGLTTHEPTHSFPVSFLPSCSFSSLRARKPLDLHYSTARRPPQVEVENLFGTTLSFFHSRGERNWG